MANPVSGYEARLSTVGWLLTCDHSRGLPSCLSLLHFPRRPCPPHLPPPPRDSGVAGVDDPRLRVCDQYRSKRDDRLFTDANARADQRKGSHPGPIADTDRIRNKSHAHIAPVVIASAQIRTLRNAGVRPNVHRRQVVDPRPLTDPGVVAHSQSPRKLDSHARFDEDASSDLCPKAAENPPLERIGGHQRVSKQQCLHAMPEHSTAQRASGCEVTLGVPPQIYHPGALSISISNIQ